MRRIRIELRVAGNTDLEAYTNLCDVLERVLPVDERLVSKDFTTIDITDVDHYGTSSSDRVMQMLAQIAEQDNA